MDSKALMVAVAAALFGTTLVFAHSFEVGDLAVGHPWARPTAPGATIGAGYLTVTNNGAEADRLIGGSSTAAARVELHTMSMDEGVMKMRAVEGFEIAPGETLTLAPGGNHLMLMDLAGPLVEGASVPATLTFEKAGTVDVELMIEKMPSEGPGSSGEHSGHGGMDHGGH
ncbi:MAG: copper chaperone PCu(A)C [Alphaproteobacteria bacterium]|nr:copper chaperone PCu(A)C [Alphaproteobacteria bacterium]